MKSVVNSHTDHDFVNMSVSSVSIGLISALVNLFATLVRDLLSLIITGYAPHEIRTISQIVEDVPSDHGHDNCGNDPSDHEEDLHENDQSDHENEVHETNDGSSDHNSLSDTEASLRNNGDDLQGANMPRHRRPTVDDMADISVREMIRHRRRHVGRGRQVVPVIPAHEVTEMLRENYGDCALLVLRMELSADKRIDEM